MFFHWTNFTQYISEDQARLISKVCNQIIDQKGRLVFGSAMSDNRLDGFSTEKKKSDTHVAVVLGVEQMGYLQPSDSPIQIDRPTEEDFAKAQAEENEYLKKRIKQMESQR